MRDSNYFEWAFIILLALGVLSAFLINNVFVQGLAIFVFGILASTLQQLKKTDFNFPYVILIIGFMVGYLISTESSYRLLMLILFGLGIIVGYNSKVWVKKYYKSLK